MSDLFGLLSLELSSRMSNKQEHGEKLCRETHAPCSFVHEELCGGKLRVEVSTTELQNGGFWTGVTNYPNYSIQRELVQRLGAHWFRSVSRVASFHFKHAVGRILLKNILFQILR